MPRPVVDMLQKGRDGVLFTLGFALDLMQVARTEKRVSSSL
jgi:hypothetical protein